MGYQIGNVCYADKQDAENAHFSQVLPVLTADGRLLQMQYQGNQWTYNGVAVRAIKDRIFKTVCCSAGWFLQSPLPFGGCVYWLTGCARDKGHYVGFLVSVGFFRSADCYVDSVQISKVGAAECRGGGGGNERVNVRRRLPGATAANGLCVFTESCMKGML